MTKTAFLIILLLAACGSITLNDDPADGLDAATDPVVVDGGDGTGDVEDYVSGDRIKARVLTTPDGARVLDGWHDTLLDVGCFFQDVGNGVKRCYPTGAMPTHGIFYEDAGCVVDVATLPNALAECMGTPPYSIGLTPSSQTCNTAKIEYVSVTAEIMPTELFRMQNDICVIATLLSDHVFYLLGPEVPLSTFQRATVTIE